MKPGFSLIELLVSTVIASMIIMGLLTTLYMTTRIQTQVDQSTKEIMRVSLIYRLLGRDSMGVFLPKSVAQETAGEEKDQKTEAQPQEKKEEAQDKKKKEDVTVKKVFYATGKNDNFELLTFVTSSAIPIFVSPVSGTNKSRIARVVYRLEKDTQKPNSLKLTRQEGTDLNYESYQPGAQNAPRIYEVANDIKQMKISYFVHPIPKKKEGEKPAEQEEKIVWQKKIDWKPQTKEEREKNPLPFAPQQIEIQLTLWNGKKEGGTYTVTLPILSDMVLQNIAAGGGTPQPVALRAGQK